MANVAIHTYADNAGKVSHSQQNISTQKGYKELQINHDYFDIWRIHINACKMTANKLFQ